ncbi:hypothetical protein JTE90_009544 [Oedothorax gibbosus]|uniref:Uncharacterized protein n=1 Tax=Oedothorax gibbosus TaxID=931172 RepID=A0AAV6UT05_9ARAC|nr:hypothetical protein JTE90_009544 [Oedothorax gibbosus]
MDGMQSTMFPVIPDKNRSYMPLGLTSASPEFPSFAMLNRSLYDRIALILYYAHIMDQKKVLYDFYKLCLYNFEDKSHCSSSESSINEWIKNAIVKLYKRREVIVSKTVDLQVSHISQVDGVLCDYLVDVGKKCLISGVNAWPKRQCDTKSNYLFPNIEMLMLNAICSSFSPFLCFEENNKISVSMNNSLHYLRNFWLEFCYHPDPTQYIKFIHFQEDPAISNSTQHSSDNPESTNSTNPSSDSSEGTNSMQKSSDDTKRRNSMRPSTHKATETTNSTQQSTEDPETIKSSIILQNNRIMDNTNSTHHSTNNLEIRTNSTHPIMNIANSTEHSDDDQSTLSSQSDSDSSDSWSCSDFQDESISDDDHLCSYTSNNKFLEKCNATINWLQSTACDFDSDDDCLNFSQALTEENCIGSPSSRGSLNFVDCSDEEDDYEVIFFDGSSDTGFENDAFMDMSQGFENPCFEDSFRGFPAASFIEMVNEGWNDDMMELRDKPRKPSKVSFAPEPNLVTVKYFEKTDENTFDASLVLDNLRFRKRITELGHLLSPFLTIEHRMVVQKRNCFCELH